MVKAHEIEYRLIGDDMQVAEIELDPGESIVAEAGSLMYMEPGIKMETIFGDGSLSEENRSIVGKIFGASKRLLTGESLFMTLFTNTGNLKSRVCFSAPYPGKIIPIMLPEYDGCIICQKDAFLCAAKGVTIGIEFTRKLGTGFFGGEGFIMEKLEGDGLAFLHAGGTIIKKDIKHGEILKIDTGCLVGMTGTVSYDVEFIGSIKTAVFGGEGLFLTTLTGPGTVWIQSLPFSRLADRIYASAPKTGGNTKGEGSLLGKFGNILDGDNR